MQCELMCVRCNISVVVYQTTGNKINCCRETRNEAAKDGNTRSL